MNTTKQYTANVTVALALILTLTAHAAPSLTKQTYDQIQLGMSYEQVSAIIGESGDKVFELVTAEEKLATYCWYNGDDGCYSGNPNIIAMFTNNRLTTKQQSRLPR